VRKWDDKSQARPRSSHLAWNFDEQKTGAIENRLPKILASALGGQEHSAVDFVISGLASSSN
jgi:hypothetical protein